MTQFGFRTIEEMVRRVDKLEINPDVLRTLFALPVVVGGGVIAANRGRA